MEVRRFELAFPTDTNYLGTLFGSTQVPWIDKAAAFAAIRRARSTVVMVTVEDIEFKTPIKQVGLVSRVEEVGCTSMHVWVEVIRENPMDDHRELCTVGHFTMVALGEDGGPKPVPPQA